MSRSTVAVKFVGDVASLKRSIGSVDRDMKGLGSNFAKFGKIAAGGLAAGGVAAVAFGATSVDAFIEAEEAQAHLSAAFEKFPQLADANIEALRDLNSELAKKTKFDDDATASGQAVLAQFGLTADQIAAATPLIQDYAAKTGKDLPTAAQDFGKSLLGQSRAFKAIGLNLKDTGSAAGNFEQIMAGLTDKVGGFAEKQGKTAAGQAEILKNQFGELQEEVGSKLVPALLKVAQWINTSVVPAMQRIADVVRQHWPQIRETINTAVQGVVDTVTPIVQALQALWQNFGDNVLSFVRRVWPSIQQTISGAMEVIRGVIQTVTSLIKGDWSGVWEGLKHIVHGAFNVIVGRIKTAMEAVRLVISVALEALGGLFSGAWNGIIDFFKSVPAKLKAAGSGLFDFLKNAFKSAVNWIIRAWNGLEFKIPGFDPPGPGPKFGGFTLGVPNIPELATGGEVMRTGLAVVHRGEKFSGTRGQYPIGTRQQQPIVVSVQLNGREIAQAVAEYEASQARNRGVG